MHPPTNYAPPFNITRASHLVFTARDLKASRAFYTEVVGLVVSDENGDFHPSSCVCGMASVAVNPPAAAVANDSAARVP